MEENMCQNNFNPLEEFVKRGTGFVNGEKRVLKFFQENKNKKDRVDFLKNEFGVGGFSFSSTEANLLTRGDTNAKEITLRYNNDTDFGIEKKYTWKELVDCIDAMIEKEEYVNEKI